MFRNRQGDFIACRESIHERKYAWLQVVSRDQVFKRYFEFTTQPKSQEEIRQAFNTASARYLIRWGRWLGKTLYIPRLEAYRSFCEAEIPRQEEFWRTIKAAYKRLVRQSWSGIERTSMEVGELRVEVCTSHSMLPLTFDCCLALLYQGRQHYTELELVGLPPHRLKQRVRQSKLDPVSVNNKQYYYIIIHM